MYAVFLQGHYYATHYAHTHTHTGEISVSKRNKQVHREQEYKTKYTAEC